MTEDTARRVADVILAAAALGIAIYVVRTPPLRRIAWRLAVTTLTSTAPMWFRQELQHAWAESGHASPGQRALT